MLLVVGTGRRHGAGKAGVDIPSAGPKPTITAVGRCKAG